MDYTFPTKAEIIERELKYFTDAIRRDGGALYDRGVTKRKSCCTICTKSQNAGVRKFWWKTPSIYTRLGQVGFESFYVHPCPECLRRITDTCPNAIQHDLQETVTQ